MLATEKISSAQLLRPYPQFTDIIPLYSTGASSNYHALQVSFSKRFSRGFQFEGNYTWAKAIQEAWMALFFWGWLCSVAVRCSWDPVAWLWSLLQRPELVGLCYSTLNKRDAISGKARQRCTANFYQQ